MSQEAPWSVPVRIEDIAETGKHFEMAADQPVRSAVAAAAFVPGISRLEATFDVEKSGSDGLRVTGTVRGTVEQVCSITLEPMTSEVSETVDLTFRPAAQTQAARRSSRHGADMADDESEVLVDGRIDLGAIATEFLILGIDPYPRKQGAVFAGPPPAGEKSSPFEVLARLKK